MFIFCFQGLLVALIFCFLNTEVRAIGSIELLDNATFISELRNNTFCHHQHVDPVLGVLCPSGSWSYQHGLEAVA